MAHYLIIDTRPTTIAAGYPNGRPIRCGVSKHGTVEDVLCRISQRSPTTNKSVLILESLGEHFRIDLVANCVTDKWLRAMFPQRADQVNKRRKRYEESLSEDDLKLISTYIGRL